MPIVYPNVDSPDMLADLLAWPATEGPVNRIQIERSSTGGGIGYANIGSVTLVSPTLDYTFYDVNGTASDFYRWYFSNAANSFPTSGNRQYSPEIQPADRGSGLLCSVGDVKQELGTTATSSEESVLEKIQQVSTAIMGYTGRWFASRPSSGTQTWYFNVKRPGYRLCVPQGIVSVTSVEAATYSQPASGGTFTTVPTADWFLHPLDGDRDYGWPATDIVLTDYPSSGSASYFYTGYNTVRLVARLGWPSVPADIQGVAVRAVARREIGKGGGASIAIGPEGTEFLLPDLSGSDRKTLDWYRVQSID